MSDPSSTGDSVSGDVSDDRGSGSVLDRIVERKRLEIEQSKQRQSFALVQKQAAASADARDFIGAIATQAAVSLIAEVKKASPSKGVIRDDFDPLKIAQTYEQHGATCISVLTDESFFQGHLDYLKQIVASVSIPVLRKEFVLDPYQVYEARAAGADAVLLIAECLSPDLLGSLRELIENLGMTALVELYETSNIEAVRNSGAKLIGINNRNLHNFQTDLEHTFRIQAEFDASRLIVSESGISSRQDVLKLEKKGVAAMLVGESLMRQPDIGAAVDDLLGRD